MMILEILYFDRGAMDCKNIKLSHAKQYQLEIALRVPLCACL